MHSQSFITKVKALKRYNSWKRIPLLIGSGAKTIEVFVIDRSTKSYKFTRVWPSSTYELKYNVARLIGFSAARPEHNSSGNGITEGSALNYTGAYICALQHFASDFITMHNNFYMYNPYTLNRSRFIRD